MNPDFQLLEWLSHGAGTVTDDFASFQASTGRLDLYKLRENPFTSIRESRLHFTRDAPGLSCISFCPHSFSTDASSSSRASLFAAGTSSGGVSLLDLSSPSTIDVTVNTQSKYGRRPCTGVAWHPTNSLLAATFDKLRSEHSGIVWNIEAVSKGSSGEDSIVAKVSYDEAASALGWVSGDGSEPLLAMGTGKGLLKVYDIRTNKPAEVLQVPASSRKIKGLRSSPFHSHLIATFVDSAAEPVKVWDIRKGSAGAGKAKSEPAYTLLLGRDPGDLLGGGGGGGSSLAHSSSAPTSLSGTITDIQWSTHRQNLICAAVNQSKDLRFYDLEGTSGSSVFSISSSGSDPIRAMAWQRPSGDGRAPPRLLLASAAGFLDTMVVERVPLGFGTSNHLAFGAGRLLKTSYISVEGTDLSGGFGVRDIEMTMRTRASRGYCIEAVKNIQVLNMELQRLHDIGGGSHSKEQSFKECLCRLWTWIDRAESIIDSGSTKDLTLQTCGVFSVIQTSIKKEGKSEAVCIDGLRTTQYRSSGRQLARRLCGWCGLVATSARDQLISESGEATSTTGSATAAERDGAAQEFLDDLDALTEECELLDGFERAAAIALLHGNIDKSVQILEKHSFGAENESHRYKPDEDDDADGHEHGPDDTNGITPDYRHLCSLVAMCIAGYSGSHTHAPHEIGHEQAHTHSHVHHAHGHSSPKPSRRHSLGGGVVSAGSKVPSERPMASADVEMNEADRGGANSAWSSLCSQVIARIAKATSSRPSACYLKMACKFLLCSLHTKPHTAMMDSEEDMGPFEPGSAGEKYWPILKSQNISLEDRTAFACTYLSDSEVLEYLSTLRVSCIERGDFEGLLITGVGGKVGGKELLQRCVDVTHDIQTTALLVCRTLITADEVVAGRGGSKVGKTPDKLTVEDRDSIWLYEYRQLLNRWEMFMERAALDVALGNRYRYLMGRKATALSTSAPSSSASVSRTATADARLKPSSASKVSSVTTPGGGASGRTDENRSLYRLPVHTSSNPHVFLRCNFCASSLPVDSMQKQVNGAWLRRQRPVISCCPNCKKPLPRCYVCLLYMGMVNPQVEYNRAVQRKRAMQTAVATASKEEHEDGGDREGKGVEQGGVEQEDHNVLDYGIWFMFCQLCKHGGHAGCLEKWFAGGHGRQHRVCGVNGCNCLCHNVGL